MKHYRFMAIVVCFLAVTSPAWALFDSDAKVAAAKELTQLLGMTDYFKGGFTNAGAMAGTMVAKANPGKEDQAKQIVAKAYDDAYRASKDEIENNNAKVYADTYSLEELQQMIAFFKLPVGQKLVQHYRELNSTVMAENSRITSEAMKGTLQKLTDELRKNDLSVPREVDVIMHNYAMVMSKEAEAKQCYVKK